MLIKLVWNHDIFKHATASKTSLIILQKPNTKWISFIYLLFFFVDILVRVPYSIYFILCITPPLDTHSFFYNQNFWYVCDWRLNTGINYAQVFCMGRLKIARRWSGFVRNYRIEKCPEVPTTVLVFMIFLRFYIISVSVRIYFCTCWKLQ